MVDREKLMTTLQYRINEARNKGSKVTTIFISTLSDCMTLLKEQEAEVEPKRMYHAERASFDNYLCECKAELYYRQRYCDVCGRSVKWE